MCADWIPVLSQTKSLFQALAGDREGAKRTQENFSRQCPGVSQLRSVVEVTVGDPNSAVETQKEFVRNTSGVVNAVPLVGHVKGGAHYAFGDKEGGDNAINAASRTTAAITGGVGGFIAGGPKGAVAGGTRGAGAFNGQQQSHRNDYWD